MTEPTLSDCINYMKQQLKGMEKSPKSYEFNIPYYRKTIEFLEEGRPHGEWFPTDEMGYMVRCSKCNFVTHDDISEEYNFCPNCGAEMKKER